MPIYLKYGDIKGEVKEPAHREWIELLSVSFGPQQNPLRPGEGGKYSDLHVTKKVDNASIGLYRECVNGTEARAFIDYVREGGGVLYRFELSGTLITSWNHSGSGADADESLTLNFREIKYTPEPGTPPP